MCVCALLAKTWDDAPAPVDVGDGDGDLGPPAPGLGVLWVALTTPAATLSWRPKRKGKCAVRVIDEMSTDSKATGIWRRGTPYESS